MLDVEKNVNTAYSRTISSTVFIICRSPKTSGLVQSAIGHATDVVRFKVASAHPHCYKRNGRCEIKQHFLCGPMADWTRGARLIYNKIETGDGSGIFQLIELDFKVAVYVQDNCKHSQSHQSNWPVVYDLFDAMDPFKDFG